MRQNGAMFICNRCRKQVKTALPLRQRNMWKQHLNISIWSEIREWKKEQPSGGCARKKTSGIHMKKICRTICICRRSI